jgi:photosystem II stability/assembly factor-like uncharacterized protein
MIKISKLSAVFFALFAIFLSSCSEDPIVDPGTPSVEFENFGAPSSVFGNRIVKTRTGDLLLATGGGLYHYKFSSSSWEIVGNNDMWGYNIEDVAIMQNGNVVCGSPNRALFLSTDNGSTWKTTLVSNTLKGIRFYIGNRFESWASIKGENGKYTALRTEDYGATWAQRVTPKNAPEDRISLCFNDSDDVFFANGDGLYRSLDSGRTYTKMNSKSDIQSMLVNASNEILLFDAGTGAIATDSGRTVTTASLPSNVTEVVFTPEGNLLATQAVPNGVLYQSNDGGHEWVPLYPFSRPLTGVVKIGGTLYVSTQGLGVLYGGGDVWFGMGPGISTVYGLAVYKNDNLLAASYGIFASANGSLWTSFGTNSELSSYIAYSKQGVAARTTSGIVYVSSNDGDNWGAIPGLTNAGPISFLPNGNGIVGTSSMLATITTVPPAIAPLPISGTTNVSSVAVSNSYSIYYSGTGTSGAGTWRSLDSGKTFSVANKGIENILMTSMAVASTGTVYACDGTKLYQSKDNGATWTTYSIGGLGGGDKVNAMTFRSDGKLYLGTNAAIIRSKAVME